MKESMKLLELKLCQMGCACVTGRVRVRARVSSSSFIFHNHPVFLQPPTPSSFIRSKPRPRPVDHINQVEPELVASLALGTWHQTGQSLLWPRFPHMSHMSYLTSRSFCKAVATLASSRLRAPKTRPLTTTAPSSALNENPQLQSHPSAATHSTRTAADHSSSALRQQPQQHFESESLPTSPSSSSPRKEKRPLQPYELSRRIIAVCQRGDVDLAVTSLQKAPRNAQNIKVWNTVIQQCMSAKKYKLAYSVFTDVCVIPSPPLVFVTCQWLTKKHVLDETSRFRPEYQDVCHDDERLCHCR
jgi:hypothetical protein